MTITRSNKQAVLDFFKTVLRERDTARISEFVTEDYMQHNPTLKTGKEGLVEAIEFLKQFPKPAEQQASPVKLILQDGDFVATLMLIEFAGKNKAVVDVFRFERGMIAEHWDAVEDRAHSVYAGLPPIAIGNNNLEPEHLDLNKQIANDFCQNILIGKQFARASEYADTGFMHSDEPEDKLAIGGHDYRKVHRTFAEGNFVLTQSTGQMDDKQFVAYDVFSLRNHKIAGRWCVKQIVPETIAHQNGMV